MSFKLIKLYPENGKVGDRIMADIHCDSEMTATPNSTGSFVAEYSHDPRSSPPHILTFRYAAKNGNPPHIRTWDSTTKLGTKVQTWLLKYPEGTETVEILSSDSGGDPRTIPDPYKWLRRLMPWRKFPPPPIFRIIPRT